MEKSEGRNSHNSKINENVPNKKTGKIDMIKSREQKFQREKLKELNYNDMEEEFDEKFFEALFDGAIRADSGSGVTFAGEYEKAPDAEEK